MLAVITLCLYVAVFLLPSVVLPTAAQKQNYNATAPKLSAVIVFGDSIVDPGNNNNIKTIVKCNFPPYGVDFVGHMPTGRFCNGKIPGDFLVSMLGIKEYLPAYLEPNLGPEDLLTGVSFASGGAGYDPLTSKIASVISLDQQIELFKEYRAKLVALVGEQRTAEIIRNSGFLVCIGSDDIANTYFGPFPFRKKHYDYRSYANLLLNSAANFYQELISLGATKIGIVNVPPIGCVPSQRTLGGGMLRYCSSKQNQLAMMVNSGLGSIAQSLSSKHPELKIVDIDIFSMLMDMILYPTKYGFGIATKGCCGTGDLEVSVLCNSLTSCICNNVTNYVFWDSYHPTERAYEVLVDQVYDRYIHVLLE